MTVAAKLKTSDFELCKGLPRELLEAIMYIKSLGTNPNPDYAYLHSLIEQIKSKAGLKFKDYDWNNAQAG